MLLIDGAGPLYFRSASHDLAAAAADALAELEPALEW